MRLGFERASNTLKGRVMRFGSGGDFIHCQFIFDQYDRISASAWDVYGIGFRTYDETVKDESLWEFMDFGTEKDEALYAWFRSRLGTPYDLAGLVTSFLVRWRKPQNPKMFCSEVCYHACQEVLQLNLPPVNANYLSPQGLYNLIKNNG